MKKNPPKKKPSITEYCICGHSTFGHAGMKGIDDYRWCFMQIGHCKHFKLDNLQLIEDLAKQRNLV